MRNPCGKVKYKLFRPRKVNAWNYPKNENESRNHIARSVLNKGYGHEQSKQHILYNNWSTKREHDEKIVQETRKKIAEKSNYKRYKIPRVSEWLKEKYWTL